MKNKHDLINYIEQAKTDVETNTVDVNRIKLFEKYRKVLVMNNIKNDVLIEKQLNRLLDLNSIETDIYANLKFMNLFRSRMMEEGLSKLDSEQILTYINFDMSGINEDDDFIGDIAWRMATLCKLIYDKSGLDPRQYSSYNISMK